MEPICGTLGLVASVGSVVTVIGKSVQTLTNLRQKYKEAEFNIGLLTGHLRTVGAALSQVQKWAEELSTGEPQHRQLLVDLENAIDNCGTSVDYIHTQISKLEWADEGLRFGSKVLLILEDQATKDFLDLLDHQLNALNLLITAFRCRSPSEQQRLLEKEESREVFHQARDDATSLVGFRDSASFSSSTVRNSIDTQLSKTFDFDGLLLRHKAYQNTFRSMMKRAVSPTENRTEEKVQRRASCDISVLQLKSMAKDSAKIDSKLKEDARKRRKEIKILAVGDKHGRSSIVKQLRHRYGHPFTDAEVEQYRRSITRLVIKGLVAILDYVKDLSVGLVSQVSRDHENLIRDFAMSAGPAWRISSGVALSVKQIWQNWHVRQAFSTMQQHGQTAYYLTSIERICQPGYVPTNMDIIRAPETIDTMKETELVMPHMKTFTLQVIEIKEQQALKIISQFADVQFCLFAIDLTCYNRYLDDTKRTNALQDRLSYLNAICRSSFFARTIILLVLTNAAGLKKQIGLSPLKSHFDDYTGGNDASAATEYILKRCKKANRRALPLFWHVYDCAVNSEAQATDSFFCQSAASISTMSWLREIGFGAGS